MLPETDLPGEASWCKNREEEKRKYANLPDTNDGDPGDPLLTDPDDGPISCDSDDDHIDGDSGGGDGD